MTWTTRPRSDFGLLAAIRSGKGASLLLLHGVGLRAEAWNGQLDGLADQFAMVAPDMPGHGESAFAGGLSTLADYTDRIAQALDRPYYVAGHSMGALIALDLAIRYPDKVRSVAALNAFYQRTDEARKAMHARATSLDGVSVADPSETLNRWFGDVRSAELVACRNWLTNVNPAGYKTAYTILAGDDGPPETGLEALGCPALFMTGAEEPNSTPAMSQAMAKLSPKGQATIVDRAAHMMPMTHTPIVNDALRHFFLRHSD